MAVVVLGVRWVIGSGAGASVCSGRLANLVREAKSMALGLVNGSER